MTLSFFKIHFHNLVSRIIQSFGLVQMNETDCTVGIMNSSLSFTVLSLVCTNNMIWSVKKSYSLFGCVVLFDQHLYSQIHNFM